MPVRSKAVATIFSLLMGDQPYHFNNLPGHATATVNGVVMPREEFDEKYMDPIERVFERVVDSIDWNRVMLEALSRHLALEKDPDHDPRGVGADWDDLLCPECLCEALLADDTIVSWKDRPKAPRYHEPERGTRP